MFEINLFSCNVYICNLGHTPESKRVKDRWVVDEKKKRDKVVETREKAISEWVTGVENGLAEGRVRDWWEEAGARHLRKEGMTEEDAR